jgi:hypothetical protein
MSILDDIGDCPLHRRTPFGMKGVSQTQLSIARHYGGIVYQGDRYIYNTATDELIRDDVLRWKTKRGKPAKPAKAKKQKQKELL